MSYFPNVYAGDYNHKKLKFEKKIDFLLYGNRWNWNESQKKTLIPKHNRKLWIRHLLFYVLYISRAFCWFQCLTISHQFKIQFFFFRIFIIIHTPLLCECWSMCHIERERNQFVQMQRPIFTRCMHKKALEVLIALLLFFLIE